MTALLWAAFFLSAPAQAKCVTETALRASVTKIRPNAILVDEVGAPDAGRIVDTFNNKPPKSALISDRIIVFSDDTLPPANALGIFFFYNGCLMFGLEGSIEEWRLLKSSIPTPGRPA